MSATKATILLNDILPESVQSSRWSQIAVNGLTVDSRAVKAGNCFLAYPGHAADGRRFIADALVNGAAAVIAEADGLDLNESAPVVAVADLRQHLGEIASRFFGNPSRHMQLVAVTGTNGKTTVTHLIAQAAQLMARKGGVIGTLGSGPIDQLTVTANTTPDIISINAALRDLLSSGVSVVAMEASSHGLVQGRLDGLEIHTGIITNLSRDHLDYHGSMDAYRDAKALLARHSSLKNLILNLDDASVAEMAVLASAAANVYSFSLHADADATVKAERLSYSSNGLSVDVSAMGQLATIHSTLVGEFNAANLLAAVAGLLALGFELAQACTALSRIAPVAGRMQMINADSARNEPAVVVDFAHTPDALEKVLTALQRHCEGKLWCVFGCGGDRDTGKRPLMGAAVAQFAECMVITSDNPRSEKLARIIADIVRGVPVGHAFEIIEDRAAAIEYAILNAAADDLVLLAGKGHEDYQEVLGIKQPFSDVLVARQMLDKRMHKSQNRGG